MSLTRSQLNGRSVADGMRDYISFTALSTFQACPLRYYFKYVRGLPAETISASLVFGSAMHRAVQFHFEELLTGSDGPGLDTLLDVFQAAWKEHEQKAIRFSKGENFNILCRLADRM